MISNPPDSHDATELMKRRQQAKENKIAMTKRGKIKEKQQEAKTALMEQALTMGKVEEVKEQLHFLKEFNRSMDNIKVEGESASEGDASIW
jgi:hypothetical protein